MFTDVTYIRFPATFSVGGTEYPISVVGSSRGSSVGSVETNTRRRVKSNITEMVGFTVPVCFLCGVLLWLWQYSMMDHVRNHMEKCPLQKTSSLPIYVLGGEPVMRG